MTKLQKQKSDNWLPKVKVGWAGGSRSEVNVTTKKQQQGTTVVMEMVCSLISVSIL